MPTYEYRCKKCGDFEKFQSMKEEALSKCPQCGEQVQKLISRPTIIFNGSGFYATDYGKNNHSNKSNGQYKSASSSTKQEPQKETTAKPDSSSTAKKTDTKDKSA